MFIERYPDKLALLEFFESGPVEADKNEGRYAYTYQDKRGIVLTFSFCVVEGWIQSHIYYQDELIQQSLIENVSSFTLQSSIKGSYLYAEIITSDTSTGVTIKLEPVISINWNTLMR